jgi:hypothetical protein
MAYGIRKGLEDVAYELKGIRNILASFWALQEGATDRVSTNPEVYADEYISTEECARRLGISDQTIRNWIATGKQHPDKGWREGIHYVNINPSFRTKTQIRVPWNHLVRSFSKNPECRMVDYVKKANNSYRHNPHSIDAYLNSLEKEADAEETDTTSPSI